MLKLQRMKGLFIFLILEVLFLIIFNVYYCKNINLNFIISSESKQTFELSYGKDTNKTNSEIYELDDKSINLNLDIPLSTTFFEITLLESGDAELWDVYLTKFTDKEYLYDHLDISGDECNTFKINTSLINKIIAQTSLRINIAFMIGFLILNILILNFKEKSVLNKRLIMNLASYKSFIFMKFSLVINHRISVLKENKHIKTIMKYRRKLLLIFLGIGYICTLYCINNQDKIYIRSESIGVSSEKPVGSLADGNYYKQTFIAEQDGLSSIGIKMGLYGATSHNNVTVVISDSDKVIEKKTFDTFGRKDNSYQLIDFNPVEDSKDKMFTIMLSSDAKPDQKVTVWASNEDVYHGGELWFNNELTGTDIDLRLSYGKETTNLSLFLSISFCFALLSLCVINCKGHKKRNIVIVAIYILTLLFHVYKANYYMEYVKGFPDERVQIQYVAYMNNNPKFMPDFKNLHMGHCSTYNEIIDCDIDEKSTNYLGHPPLYYYLMSKVNSVHLDRGRIYGNVVPLRIANVFISVIGLSIVFLLGYKLIRKTPILHAFFAICCISVPMFSYLSGAVNNDNLAFLGSAIYLLGAFKFLEKENQTSYLLIAIGLCITVMSKVTAGLILLIGTILFLIYKMIKTKSLKPIVRKEFLITLPLYSIVCLYFLMLYSRYHTFQPSLAMLNPDYYVTTGFYIPKEQTVTLSLYQYLNHYCEKFFQTWYSIASHITLLKDPRLLSKEVFALVFILLGPIIIFFRRLPKDASLRNKMVLIRCLLIGVYFTMISQFFTAYSSFNKSGYLGGYQSRYYLCVLPVFSLALIYSITLKMEWRGKIGDLIENNYKYTIFKGLMTCILVVLIILLVYEDFIYFLLYFQNYS